MDEKRGVESDDLSTLERVRQKLYGVKDSIKKIEPVLRKASAPAQTGWMHLHEGIKKIPLPSSQGFLIFSIGFFIIAVLIAGAFLFFGNRFITSEQVAITIEAPSTVSGGDGVSFIIGIRNNNPTNLKNAKLVVQFPEGTFASDGVTPQTRYEEELGEIKSGHLIERTLSAVMFGDVAERIAIPIILEYETEQSDSKFVKKKSYEFTIDSSPVLLSIESLSSVASGEELVMQVKARANTPTPLTGVAIKAEYPFGFIPTSISPDSTQNDFFDVGELTQGQEKVITIRGTMTGEDSQERIFRFTAGAKNSAQPGDLGVVYAVRDAKVVINKPFLNTVVMINRERADTVVVSPFDSVSTLISWENTTGTRISDATLSVRLTGEGINISSITTPDGFFDSNTNAVIFSKEYNDRLALLTPNDTGNGSFFFELVSLETLRRIKNPQIEYAVSITGRSGETGATAQVRSALSKVIKVSSDLSLSSRIVRTVGNIENMGPWPPEVGKETTYTVIVTAENFINTVADVVVKGTLPSYARFTGFVYPADAKILYNADTHEVIWAVDEMPAGAGSRSVQFQIAVTPSESQRGTTPDMFINQTISGFDRFTQSALQSDALDLTTLTETDPSFNNSQGSVK